MTAGQAMTWLRAAGNRVVDGGGQPVVLRGVGIGGWLNMENFITGFPATESAHRRALRRVLGQRRYELLSGEFLRGFFGPADAGFIAALGLNAVRIPVNYRHLEDDDRPGVIRPEGFVHLDRAVRACASAGLYTIIDLHAAPGGQNHHWHSDNPFHQPQFWDHPGFQDRAVALWRAIAGHYRDDPSVAGYNILNEPADEQAGRLVAFYHRAVAAIREIDPRHMVFLDGNRYAREFPGFGDGFANAVYAIHHYPAPGSAAGGPYPGLTDGRHYDRDRVAAEFRSLTRYMDERGLPVWVGEFGPVYDAGPARDQMRRQLLSDQLGVFSAARAGWSLWTYKDIGLQGLVTVAPDAPWMRRTAAVRAKKKALGADHWGGREDGIRDVMEPVVARFEREFPDFDPYPFGRRRYVEQLVRNILFAEPLSDEFAACFADADDDKLADLARSFSFGRCVEQKQLCDVIRAAALPAGARAVHPGVERAGGAQIGGAGWTAGER